MSVLTDEAAYAPRPGAATPPAPTRPFYWSVRRELWENRSLYIAPLAVSVLVLVGFLISTIGMPHRRLDTLALPLDKQISVMSEPYDGAAFALVVTTVLVAVAYCLGALHGERRDRSILFWKSLPVSDLTTVLAKMAVPMAVAPAIGAAVILAVQLAIFLISSLVLAASGVSAAVPPGLAAIPVVMLYGVVTMTLWYAPLYAWFLLVSGWARRAPFLWAVLPPLALALFERLAFHSTHVIELLIYRLTGDMSAAFADKGQLQDGLPVEGLARLDPGKFLATPGLWLGLAFAAACLAGAVWLRRRREPI